MKTKLAFLFLMSLGAISISLTNKVREITVNDVEALTLVERRLPRPDTGNKDWVLGYRLRDDVFFMTQEEFWRDGYWYHGSLGMQYHQGYYYMDDVQNWLSCCMIYAHGQECNFANDISECENVANYGRPTNLGL